MRDYVRGESGGAWIAMKKPPVNGLQLRHQCYLVAEKGKGNYRDRDKRINDWK